VSGRWSDGWLGVGGVSVDGMAKRLITVVFSKKVRFQSGKLFTRKHFFKTKRTSFLGLQNKKHTPPPPP